MFDADEVSDAVAAYRLIQNDAEAVAKITNNADIVETVEFFERDLAAKGLSHKLTAAATRLAIKLDAMVSKFYGIGLAFDKVTGILKKGTTEIGKFLNGKLALNSNSTLRFVDASPTGASSFSEITHIVDDVIGDIPASNVVLDALGNIHCTGTYCFMADTKMIDGRNIVDVKDNIETINPITGEWINAKVKGIKTSITNSVTRLLIAGSLMGVTPAHTLQNEAGQWIEAQNLHIGDRLRTPTGLVTIEYVCTETVEPTKVYSLELENDLPYFVGNTPVLAAGTCNFRTIFSKLDSEYGNFRTWIKENKALSSLERNQIIDDLAATLTSSRLDAKEILKVEPDAQGRLLVQYERGDKTYGVVAIQKDINGKHIVVEYAPTYKPTANTTIDVDISRNRLVPDYTTKGGKYLHPNNKIFMLENGGKGVRIEMQGTRGKDFTEAFKQLGIKDSDALKYTWHHMDDFEYINGKAYCTMQLVESAAHGGIDGMAHSGAVAQWKAFFGTKIYP
jgi:A nuclease of the HNH/ENDO VII superfamily with conserved WHH